MQGPTQKTHTHDNEQHRQHCEAHQLYALPSPLFDDQEGYPIPGDEANTGKEQVRDSEVDEVPEDVTCGNIRGQLRRNAGFRAIQVWNSAANDGSRDADGAEESIRV